MLEEEVRHLELAVEDGPGERGVEDVLRGGRAPVKVIVPSHVFAVAGKVIGEVAERRGSRVVEPALHPREVSDGRGVWQVVWHRPDACERGEEM